MILFAFVSYDFLVHFIIGYEACEVSRADILLFIPTSNVYFNLNYRYVHCDMKDH